MQLGMSSRSAFLLLFVSLAGSYVNIPIATLGHETFVTEREVEFFGMVYRVPQLVGSPEVVLAVNLGGAGTFDGIFVTGVVAVLLAGITGRRAATSA